MRFIFLLNTHLLMISSFHEIKIVGHFPNNKCSRIIGQINCENYIPMNLNYTATIGVIFEILNASCIL